MCNGSWYLTGFLQEEPLAELRDDLAELGLGRAGVTETEDHIAALAEVMRHLVLTGPDDAGAGAPAGASSAATCALVRVVRRRVCGGAGADFYAKVGGSLAAFMDTSARRSICWRRKALSAAAMDTMGGRAPAPRMRESEDEGRKHRASRRNFLAATGAGSAMLAPPRWPRPPPRRRLSPPGWSRSAPRGRRPGREREHMRNYYRTTRI